MAFVRKVATDLPFLHGDRGDPPFFGGSTFLDFTPDLLWPQCSLQQLHPSAPSPLGMRAVDAALFTWPGRLTN